jgi:hypothetical protein
MRSSILLRKPSSNWLLASPYHRHIPYKRIQRAFQELYAGEKAIKTVFQDLKYCRRTAKKKGFPEDPAVCRERREFCEDGITWRRERVQRICFTDEVWAFGGAHTSSYVTVLEDGSDRFSPECVRHKYRKLPAWMFHGLIVDGKKGPCLFWEKGWHTINSERYDEHILSYIERYIYPHALDGYIF